ncbi:MAG: hypothetical protein CMM75_10525 [Rhodospirillaceae bacterium]|nr:hypothetical protein [Rhodospirillaceae bacterium]
MKRGVIISAVLHVLVIALAYFGLPILFDSPKIETSPPMAIDIIVPEEKSQKSEPKPVPPPKPEPAPEPIKPPPPSPPLISPVPAPPPPLIKPAPAPKVKPPVIKTKPKLKKVKKPKRKKVMRVARVAPKPKRKPPPPDEFRKLLKDLTKRKKPAPKPLQKAPRTIKPKPVPIQPTYARRQVENELSMKVRQQIVPCWNIPGGAKDAQKMKISIRIRLKRDGSLLGSPRVVDRTRFQTDQSYRVVAESAVRALLNPRCSPLQLPYGDYDIWKDITFNFDPSEALGP